MFGRFNALLTEARPVANHGLLYGTPGYQAQEAQVLVHEAALSLETWILMKLMGLGMSSRHMVTSMPGIEQPKDRQSAICGHFLIGRCNARWDGEWPWDTDPSTLDLAGALRPGRIFSAAGCFWSPLDGVGRWLLPGGKVGKSGSIQWTFVLEKFRHSKPMVPFFVWFVYGFSGSNRQSVGSWFRMILGFIVLLFFEFELIEDHNCWHLLTYYFRSRQWTSARDIPHTLGEICGSVSTAPWLKYFMK